MKKCDVIIPVYKSPDWVKLCVYALCRNTKYINKIYLINDCQDPLTINCLENLANKYSLIKVIQNKVNLGFIKSVNLGLKESTADYVLLLNTDCIVTDRTVEKLINHLEDNDKIGLICPISSNAANLTLDMFDGFTYYQMDQLLEKKFIGKNFDACTVVGNCLMITKKCLQKVGYLDEIYGTGYGEETDYQFKAMEKGFEAKVAIDCYVFHKSEVSFGTSKEKQEKLKHNQEIFFERWGSQYQELMKKYLKNDPISYIQKNITAEDKRLNFEFLIYLVGFDQGAGGDHMTVDMINYLAINAISCNILYGFSNGYQEILLFQPIPVSNVDNYHFKLLVSTIYYSTYYAKKLSNDYNVPLISFAQGYEPYFENGTDYRIAELSYKLPDYILTISEYLKVRYQKTFQVDSMVIPNGVNYDLLYRKNHNSKIKTITILLRNNVLKGDFILLDILKQINNTYRDLEINVLYHNEQLKFPYLSEKRNTIHKIKGPFTRKEIATILQNSDLYIDASFTEGFGLMPLEAMCAGNVVVVSDSGGVQEYIEDGKNGFLIPQVNNVDAYMEKIDLLLKDIKVYQKMKNNIGNMLLNFDNDNIVGKYIQYFASNFKKKENKLTTEEENLYKQVLDSRFKVSVDRGTKNFIYKICKKMPKGFKKKIKEISAKLYHFTNEN